MYNKNLFPRLLIGYNLTVIKFKVKLMEKYNKLLDRMPASDKFGWLSWFKENNEIIGETNKFIGCLNYKTENGIKDPRFTRLPDMHFTYFAKRAKATETATLNLDEHLDMMAIAAVHNKEDFTFYINSQIKRSVKRFHFHLVYFKNN